MSVIDLSMPLSDVLKEGTKKAHEEVEVSPAATAMLRGELDKEEYVRFLMMLWHIYKYTPLFFLPPSGTKITRSSSPHTTPPCSRAPPLSADIAHLLDVPESSWKSHWIHTQLMAAKPPALETYITRIQSIADSPDPSALLAHSYVRYLGDLSGGQTIQRALAKAYGLTIGGAGLSFYAFKELHSSKPASQGEMKRIKDWFRAGMNKGAGGQRRAAVMEEASRVFEFTGEIFKAVNLEKEKSRVVYDSDADAQAPRMYSIASVSAVVIAVCVAHFVLTVGGFTGERGYEKLIAVEEWLGGGAR
ncbi:hypothetical protein MSAN_01785500 [Mycena sanguinolenta]|uniref:Heme oxygenase n=1 Tax=Mycena sanguinolenta TaxID=230812 RepID=A0A8H6XW98_9AGAR|nr:hypothetical protein MSAN_01785500 [Mycena sanguinolenta]